MRVPVAAWILILMSHEDEKVQEAAFVTNDKLISAIQLLDREQNITFAKVMPKLKEMLAISGRYIYS